jgi:hypothetical protein
MNDIKNKTFISIDKAHSINTQIIDDVGWFEISTVTYEKYKTFLLLLKDTIDYYNENNVKYIKQYITSNDLEYVKNSTCVDIDESTYIISTPIDKFIDEIVSLLAIKTL